jgi:hypothetical protein
VAAVEVNKVAAAVAGLALEAAAVPAVAGLALGAAAVPVVAIQPPIPA